MDRVRQMQIFIQVMESGNLTRAAAALGLPRSTVSTELQALEDRLKTQLLRRTTRKVVPTPDGHAFLHSARDIVDAVASAETMFTAAQPRLAGRLRVDMPVRIGRKLVIPALPEFLAAHPDLTLELGTSDRRTDLIAEGVDCVLRLGELESSELISRRIGHVAFVTCASPAYLARHGIPETLDDLAPHLLVNYATQLPTGRGALEFSMNGTLHEVALATPVTVNNAESYIACALAGLGIVQLPAFDVRDRLAKGTLVEILPTAPPPPVPLSFLFARRRNLAPRIRLFQDWLAGLLVREGVLIPRDEKPGGEIS